MAESGVQSYDDNLNLSCQIHVFVFILCHFMISSNYCVVNWLHSSDVAPPLCQMIIDLDHIGTNKLLTTMNIFSILAKQC